MVLQQGGVQDICSFQIGMKPQILNLTSVLGREVAQMAPQREDLGFMPVWNKQVSWTHPLLSAPQGDVSNKF